MADLFRKWREGGGCVGNAAGALVEIECINGEIEPCFLEGASW
jgi:hypothetical protein